MPTGAAGARLGDRKRLAGSAYVWARATCGEHVFAPTPPELRNDAARQEIWKTDLTTVCSLLKRAQRFPRYLMLKERLDAYADQLASSPDGETRRGAVRPAPGPSADSRSRRRPGQDPPC